MHLKRIVFISKIVFHNRSTLNNVFAVVIISVPFSKFLLLSRSRANAVPMILFGQK